MARVSEPSKNFALKKNIFIEDSGNILWLNKKEVWINLLFKHVSMKL